MGLPVFVYGTLRPGSWNHDRWLAPLLAGPCRPARMAGVALHHHEGLPYLVPADEGSVVVGDLADLPVDGYDRALAHLDVLEDTANDHYRRVVLPVVHGEDAWVWLAGDRVAGELSAVTLVRSGDWLTAG